MLINPLTQKHLLARISVVLQRRDPTGRTGGPLLSDTSHAAYREDARRGEAIRRALWHDVIPNEELELINAAGYGGQLSPGKRAALLVVDVTYGFTGRTPMSIAEAIATYPKSCGLAAWDAIGVIRQLIGQARKTGIPIIYTKNEPAGSTADRGLWSAKVSNAALPRDSDEIVEAVRPSDGDLVITKSKPSAFFSTPLIPRLIELGIDTLYVSGGTTSGCVRATVVDGFSNNYRMFIVDRGVFDRSKTSHKVNLFDMHHKYGQVTDVETALRAFGQSDDNDSQTVPASGHESKT